MIIVRLKGGMGNQMFQYAFARALAERNHDEVVLDAAPLLDRTPRANFVFRGYDLDIFNINARLTFFSRCALRFPMPVLWAGMSVIVTYVKSVFGVQRFIRETDDFGVASIEALSRTGNFYLDGAWQNEKYFASIAPEIRREFTLREPFSARAQKLEDEIRVGVSIGVNVRRGDFVTVQRVEYYQRGVKAVLERLRGVASASHIYVFSDEIDWCRENLKFPGMPATYVGREYAGKKFSEYLSLLASCRHFIIPNSSFAWWAAWLGNAVDKMVVAPKQWDRTVTARSEKIVPEEWMKI